MRVGSIFILHGGLGDKEKVAVIESFRTIAGPAILLLTKGVGAESLTLIEACKVFFADEHWNRM